MDWCEDVPSKYNGHWLHTWAAGGKLSIDYAPSPGSSQTGINIFLYETSPGGVFETWCCCVVWRIFVFGWYALLMAKLELRSNFSWGHSYCRTHAQAFLRKKRSTFNFRCRFEPGFCWRQMMWTINDVSLTATATRQQGNFLRKPWTQECVVRLQRLSGFTKSTRRCYLVL